MKTMRSLMISGSLTWLTTNGKKLNKTVLSPQEEMVTPWF